MWLSGSRTTCHWIRPNVLHIGILHLVSISTISPQLTCHSAPVCEILSKSDHPRQKQSKDSQNSKNHHWCTNHHNVYTESAEYTKPRKRCYGATSRNLHHMCLGSGHSPSSVGRADSMCLHGRPCVWLPRAATLCSTYWWCLQLV